MTVTFDGAAIAAATGGRLAAPGPAGPVLTDTRALAPGAWFVALKGERFDAHDFLAQADAAGVAGAVVSREIAGWTRGLVVVPDTLRALQDLGREARRRFRRPVVGLTGSAGKTTTRTLIALALAPLGKVHQTTGNLNNHIGVPMTLLATPPDAAAAVVEMGTSAPGEIAVLADIARPDVRVIVNVGAAHLEELGGLDGVAREKGALFGTARSGDIVCVNLDDPRIAALSVPRDARVITWGRAPGADLRLVEAQVDPSSLSTRAKYVTPEGELSVVIPAPGEHIAHNGAAALAVAHALGVRLRSAIAGFARYEPVGMRMRKEPLPNGAIALNDAYNANPTSMDASLRLLASLPGRRAAVLGDMLELGPSEASFHVEVAATAAGLGLDLVVLVGARMSAASAACPGAWVARDGEHLASGSLLADDLRAWLRAGDTVLFKGSRGARVERILQTVRGDASPEGGHS